MKLTYDNTHTIQTVKTQFNQNLQRIQNVCVKIQLGSTVKMTIKMNEKFQVSPNLSKQ